MAVLVALAMAAAGSAQRISVPEGPLQSGSQITIGFNDPSRAGEDITITVQGAGFPIPAEQQITITLDAAGKGSQPWTVPTGWWWAMFNAPGAEVVDRAVVSGEGGDATDG